MLMDFIGKSRFLLNQSCVQGAFSVGFEEILWRGQP